jgi:dTDP-4-amino-4,6-dideoxygalactose transaminase
MKEIEFNRFADFYIENKEFSDSFISEVLKSGDYIRGKHTQSLEIALSKLCNRNHAITTASCTDAIFFALKAAGVKEGDEVILPAFSYIASLSPILMCGAIPVFADINPNTLVLNIDLVENLIGEKTKAIIFVQLFGNITNLEKLKQICNKYNIILIEDAAQGLGSQLGFIKGASQGDFSCISFDPTKIVSAFGTGGVVLTNKEEHYSKLKMLIHHGRNENGDFEILGYNSKISELNAVLIKLQLSQLEDTILKTNLIAKRYQLNLKDIPQIEIIQTQFGEISTYHKFVIIVDKRDQLKTFLTKNGIETKIHYSPLLNEQKLLINYTHRVHDLSVSNQIKHKVLSLPIYPGLGYDEIDYICDCIKKFYKL